MIPSYPDPVPVSMDARLRPTADTQVKPVGDSGVIVDTRTGKCWELNLVGLAIWRLLGEGRSIGETVEAVHAQHAISIATATNDVLGFVQSLLREGLLELLPAAGTDEPAR